MWALIDLSSVGNSCRPRKPGHSPCGPFLQVPISGSRVGGPLYRRAAAPSIWVYSTSCSPRIEEPGRREGVSTNRVFRELRKEQSTFWGDIGRAIQTQAKPI